LAVAHVLLGARSEHYWLRLCCGRPGAHYAITDLRVHQAKPAQLATAIRGHWSIENKLHWVRDVTYEDCSQIRTGIGPQVKAALRNAAINVLRLAGVHEHRRRQSSPRPRQPAPA
jgi:hypothetical protein